MNKAIDYFIDSETDLASSGSADVARFEYYFEEDLNIKSVTLKSIMFYVAYVDLKKGILYKEDVLFLAMDHHSEIRKEINLKIIERLRSPTINANANFIYVSMLSPGEVNNAHHYNSCPLR